MSNPAVDQAYHMFDLDGSGKLTLENVPRALGHAGIVVSLEEIYKHLGIVSPMKARLTGLQSTFTLAQFQALAKKTEPLSKETNHVEELKKAFKDLSHATPGTLTAGDFSHYLSTLGDAISQQDVDILFEERKISGKITEAEFVSFMNSK